MVNGNGTTLASPVIVVPNCSSNDFLVVLKYLYTGAIEWNLDNCSSIREVGKYFGLTELENSFHGFLADAINFDSALDIYGRYYCENNIVCRTAMKIIQIVLTKYLESDPVEFFDLPTAAITQILQMDELGVNERQLFEKMTTWAEAKGNGNVSPDIGNLLKLIRFVNLADVEISSEFEGFVNLRKQIKVIQNSADWKVKGYIDNNDTEIIIIQPIRSIQLHGLSTLSFGPIFVEKNNQFVAAQCYRSKVFKLCFIDVMFENPIVIAKNTAVRLKVPASCHRYNFVICDDYSIQALRNGEAVDHVPIAGLFVSE